jgi:hypothetical protein
MVDFKALKARVTFDDVIRMLDLPMSSIPGTTPTQYRGPCPRCKQGGPRALVATEGKGFSCFAQGLPQDQRPCGDVIAFYAHVMDVPMRQAAENIQMAVALKV